MFLLALFCVSFLSFRCEASTDVPWQNGNVGKGWLYGFDGSVQKVVPPFKIGTSQKRFDVNRYTECCVKECCRTYPYCGFTAVGYPGAFGGAFGGAHAFSGGGGTGSDCSFPCDDDDNGDVDVPEPTVWLALALVLLFVSRFLRLKSISDTAHRFDPVKVRSNLFPK